MKSKQLESDDPVAKEGKPTKVGATGKKRTITAVVYPQGGGDAWEEEVQPDNEGTFTTDNGSTFTLTKGSVVRRGDGKLETICVEGNAQTFSARALEQDGVMHPLKLNSHINNNLVRQFGELARERSPWREAKTYVFMLIGLAAVGLMFWMALALGNVVEALNNFDVNVIVEQVAANGGGGNETAHQAIAPGGH